MKRLIYSIIYILCTISLIMLCSGCASLKEYWSENYALASDGAIATPPEINDGKLETFGVAKYPDREYDIILPEEREIHRITIYSVNLKSYDILCWDIEKNKWVSVGGLGGTAKRKNVYFDQYKSTIPKFEHRLRFKTNRIKLSVIRTTTDSVVTTRTPGKNEKILNQRTEYMQLGRDRMRVDLYDVFRFTDAGIREIEIYSHAKKPEGK